MLIGFEIIALNEYIKMENLTSIKQNPSKLWLNADVCRGPCDSDESVFNGAEFISLCLSKAPGTVLSLGWTTPLFVDDEDEMHTCSYGVNEIRRMKKLVQDLPSNTLLSFAVRAKLLSRTDLDLFERELMGLSQSYSLTVWTSIVDELSKTDITILSYLPRKF
uniref:Menorin-like domain-containing protein n=1 Tax=Romanomermis culicivorax TaxID=13658 RepID=A0A915JBX6_ROMCU